MNYTVHPGCGAPIAFVCNVGRTFILTAGAAKDGIETISSWHDPLGFTVLAICLLLILGFARLLSGPIPNVRPSKETTTTLAPFPWRLASGLGAWILFTVLSTEVWYRADENRATLHWSIEWPIAKKDFSDLVIPQPAADMLRFDEGHAASWTDRDGSSWTAFFFKWAAGPSRSRNLARAHRPEVCLPAAGYKLEVDRGTITIDARGLIIPFHALDFDYDGRPAHVFFSLWQDGSKGAVQPRIWDLFTRFAVTTVNWIFFTTEIPALKQGSHSRYGRFSERANTPLYPLGSFNSLTRDQEGWYSPQK